MRLPHSYQVQQSPSQSAQRATPSSEVTQLLTPAPTCPPVRRSARAKSSLVYDQKYHPLDDIIRPSQAAKRRTLHGEQPLLGSGSDGEISEVSVSDVGSMAGADGSDDEESQPTRNRKRKRAGSLPPEPTRRSSRRRSKPKTSYNMNIHPQDSDLKRVWACGGSKSSPLPTKQTLPSTAISLTRKTPSEEFEEVCRTLLDDGSEGMHPVQARPLVPVGHTNHVQTQCQIQHQRFQSPPTVFRLLRSLLFSTKMLAPVKLCCRSLDTHPLIRMYGLL